MLQLSSVLLVRFWPGDADLLRGFEVNGTKGACSRSWDCRTSLFCTNQKGIQARERNICRDAVVPSQVRVRLDPPGTYMTVSPHTTFVEKVLTWIPIGLVGPSTRGSRLLYAGRWSRSVGTSTTPGTLDRAGL